jgi:hypothetical protein
MKKNRGYQRRHIRAPFHFNVLYEDQDYVFKAKALNISEGGMLLDQLPYFPENDAVALMLSIPKFQSFKNFDVLKLKEFSLDLFGEKIIRLKAQMVRKEGIKSDIDQIMASRIGVAFTQIGEHEIKAIEEYSQNLLSNVVHLLALIDSVNYDEEALIKVKLLSQILGYDKELKLAKLRQIVHHEYVSLQWL